MAKIFLVEDDDRLRESLQEWFLAKGYVFEQASNGEDAIQMLTNFKYDVILLDWILPDITGLEVCSRFRKSGGITPIIFLTGKEDIHSKEAALDIGADDYVVKPFDIRELAARIRSVLRRPPELLPSELKLGDLKLNPTTRTVTIDGQDIHLMPKESALLEYLMRHPKHPIGAQALLTAVWPSDTNASPETVRTWMKNLRQKLAAAGKPDLIKTVPASGYMIDPE